MNIKIKKENKTVANELTGGRSKASSLNKKLIIFIMWIKKNVARINNKIGLIYFKNRKPVKKERV